MLQGVLALDAATGRAAELLALFARERELCALGRRPPSRAPGLLGLLTAAEQGDTRYAYEWGSEADRAILLLSRSAGVFSRLEVPGHLLGAVHPDTAVPGRTLCDQVRSDRLRSRNIRHCGTARSLPGRHAQGGGDARWLPTHAPALGDDRRARGLRPKAVEGGRRRERQGPERLDPAALLGQRRGHPPCRAAASEEGGGQPGIEDRGKQAVDSTSPGRRSGAGRGRHGVHCPRRQRQRTRRAGADTVASGGGIRTGGGGQATGDTQGRLDGEGQAHRRTHAPPPGCHGGNPPT